MPKNTRTNSYSTDIKAKITEYTTKKKVANATTSGNTGKCTACNKFFYSFAAFEAHNKFGMCK